MVLKLLFLTLVLGALLVFALQNTETVKVHILLWTFSLSRALLILISLLVGFLLGWGLSVWARSRPRAKNNRITPRD